MLSRSVRYLPSSWQLPLLGRGRVLPPCPTLTIAQFKTVAVELPEQGGYGALIIKQLHKPYQACQAGIANNDIHCKIEDPGLMQVSLDGIVTYFVIPDSAIAQMEVHDGKMLACSLHAR